MSHPQLVSVPFGQSEPHWPRFGFAQMQRYDSRWRSGRVGKVEVIHILSQVKGQFHEILLTATSLS